MRVPTTITKTASQDDSTDCTDGDNKVLLFDQFEQTLLPKDITDSISATFSEAQGKRQAAKDMGNPLSRCFARFIDSSDMTEILDKLNTNRPLETRYSRTGLRSSAPKRWTLYPPLIILPVGAFDEQWQKIIRDYPWACAVLWEDILETFSTKDVTYTHIAVNKGIPLADADLVNTLRAPTKLEKIYGQFGPDVCAYQFGLTDPNHPEYLNKTDFDQAFWVSSQQNGLTQIWAPRWTMFSRGNVKEKARVLTFEPAASYDIQGNGPPVDDRKDHEDLVSAKRMAVLKELHVAFPSLPIPIELKSHQMPPQSDNSPDMYAHSMYYSHFKRLSSVIEDHGFSPSPVVSDAQKQIQLAVDMYAGIGYFTLPYLKLGYDVLAFELNPFSVEGLKRGAAANDFGCNVIRTNPLSKTKAETVEKTLLERGMRPPHVFVYEANNEIAYQQFTQLISLNRHPAGNIYRIRHINLGFLPSSSGSWDTAAQLICTNVAGGYIHVHENVATKEIEMHGKKVRKAFDELVNPYSGPLKREVKIVHTEKVKTYAPDVWHVVYDVLVGPKPPANEEEKRQRITDYNYFAEA